MGDPILQVIKTGLCHIHKKGLKFGYVWDEAGLSLRIFHDPNSWLTKEVEVSIEQAFEKRITAGKTDIKPEIWLQCAQFIQSAREVPVLQSYYPSRWRPMTIQQSCQPRKMLVRFVVAVIEFIVRLRLKVINKRSKMYGASTVRPFEHVCDINHISNIRFDRSLYGFV